MISVGWRQLSHGKCLIFPKEVGIPSVIRFCWFHGGMWLAMGLWVAKFSAVLLCNQRLSAMLCYLRHFHCFCWVLCHGGRWICQSVTLPSCYLWWLLAHGYHTAIPCLLLVIRLPAIGVVTLARMLFLPPRSSGLSCEGFNPTPFPLLCQLGRRHMPDCICSPCLCLSLPPASLAPSICLPSGASMHGSPRHICVMSREFCVKLQLSDQL